MPEPIVIVYYGIVVHGSCIKIANRDFKIFDFGQKTNYFFSRFLFRWIRQDSVEVHSSI